MDTSINFDVTTTPEEIAKNLVVPMVDRKATYSVKDGSVANYSMLMSDVKVSDLTLDLSYQRTPKADKVSKIAREFNPDAFGVLICSMREDGTTVLLDGGHRVAALNLLNKQNELVRCLVFFDLTISEEAQIFTTMNENRTKPKTNDLFKSRVLSGDKDAIAIESILNANNLKPSNGPNHNSIRAIGTLLKIYKDYGYGPTAHAVRTLRIAFGSHSTSFANSALISLAKIYYYIPEGIIYDRIITSLKTFGSAQNWVNKGSALSNQIQKKDASSGMIMILATEYNKRLKKNRIDINKVIS